MSRKKRYPKEIVEVRQWFQDAVTYRGEPYVMDEEQVAAVISEDKNAIVVARAGSGKTRTIVAKIVYLIARCGVRPEGILAFVFNANAAKEINERLSEMRVNGEPVMSGALVGKEAAKGKTEVEPKVKVAWTFHAFARHIIYNIYSGKQKCGRILAGEKEKFVEGVVRGMVDKEMSEEELSRLVGQMVQFINRAQQKYLGGLTVREVAEEYLRNEGLGERERKFVEIGVECFRRYHWRLLDTGLEGFDGYGTDFNLIVSWASKLIDGGGAEVRELLDGKRYILIDEYQDFSQLFLSVVDSIRRVIPEVRLFVVGDDWQAINRFAGSDVEYFREFEKYFVPARRYEITTNYRCGREIVGRARTFMKRAMDEKGKFRGIKRETGRVVLVDTKRIRTDYLAKLVEIIRKNRKAEEILVLHRNNDTRLKMSLTGLRNALKRELIRARVMNGEEFEEKVRVMTIHKSKGLEAEVVILLEVDEGVLPKTHPDTLLYGMFGETEEVALADQKRLFYVAMTRAKKRLYIIHDFSEGMGFVKYLGRGVERWE